LGADGRLPELVLHEGEQREKVVDSEQSTASRPWMMIGVLAISLLMSILMLFLDPTSQTQEGATKTEARELIRKYYLGKDASPEPYQQVLRQAIQYHSKGDSKKERQQYRKVLDMLHAEDKNNPQGLTGMREQREGQSSGNDLIANDKHLTELLSRLIRD